MMIPKGVSDITYLLEGNVAITRLVGSWIQGNRRIVDLSIEGFSDSGGFRKVGRLVYACPSDYSYLVIITSTLTVCRDLLNPL